MYEFNNPKLKDKRKYLRNNYTDAELYLWKQLKRSQLGFKFRRQQSVGPYILDFYCPEKLIAIELDGGQHNDKGNKEYDQFRTEYLNARNIKVLRFWNNVVLREMKTVLEVILSELIPPPDPLLT